MVALISRSYLRYFSLLSSSISSFSLSPVLSWLWAFSLLIWGIFSPTPQKLSCCPESLRRFLPTRSFVSAADSLLADRSCLSLVLLSLSLVAVILPHLLLVSLKTRAECGPRQWLSTGDDFASQWTFADVWAGFWLTQLGMGGVWMS